MRQKFLQNIGPMFHDMETSEPSRLATMNDGGSMSSAVDSPAKTLATQEKAQDSQANEADCSTKPFAWFDIFGQGGSCWKTWQRCLHGDWVTFSGRWPRAGTMRSGIAYQRRPLVRPMQEIGFGLLPTPQARDWKDGADPSQHGRHSDSLPVVLSGLGHPGRMLPDFPEWAMGFPIGWTALDASETQSARK